LSPDALQIKNAELGVKGTEMTAQTVKSKNQPCATVETS